jgi:hypothetical protein
MADQQNRCRAHLLVGRVEPGQRVGPTAGPQQSLHGFGEVPSAGGGHRAARQLAGAGDVVEHPAPPPVRELSWCFSGPPPRQQMRVDLDASHRGPDGPACRGTDVGELLQRVRRLRRSRGGPSALRLHPCARVRRQRGDLQQHHAQLAPSGLRQRPGIPDRRGELTDRGHRRTARRRETHEVANVFCVVVARLGAAPRTAGRGAASERHHEFPCERPCVGG